MTRPRLAHARSRGRLPFAHTALAVLLAIVVLPTTATDAGGLPKGYTPHPTAYRGQPPLAYVSEGRLFILDGKGHPPRPVAHGNGACCLAWAPDGAHLAFQRGTELWLADVGGSAARRIAPDVRRWAWSPDGDALAAISARGTRGVDFYTAEYPRIHVRLLNDYYAQDLAWAGLGRRIAVSVTPLPRKSASWRTRTSLFMLEVPGPYADCHALCPEPVLPVDVRTRHNEDQVVFLADWSPDLSSIPIWTGHPSNGVNPDVSLELSLVSPAGGSPIPLAHVAVDRSRIQWSKSGDRLLVVSGNPRDDGSRHDLDLCVPRAACRVLNGPAVSAADPAWSSGGRIAYVAIPSTVTAQTSGDCQRAEKASQLVVAGTDGRGAAVVASGGVALPVWLPDAHHLVFLRGQRLWLLDADRLNAIPIAGALEPGHAHRETPAPGTCAFAASSDTDRRFAIAP